MYEFIRGPLVWIAFIVFIGGVLYKLVNMHLLAKKEKVIYPTMSAKYGLRSILHWVVPFGSHNMRRRPLFTIISFSFHLCLLLTPIFAMGHIVLVEEAWGISWWALPPLVADLMTLVVIAACVYFALRRLAAPQVRNVSDFADFAVVLLVVSPFATGFVAHHQWLPYEATITAHIVLGCLWLIAIPFSRVRHMLWFVFTRAFMGSEFGFVRNARDW